MSKYVEVTGWRKCDFCEDRAEYDGKTVFGPWANMCHAHFEAHGVGLGLGKGQALIYRDE